MFGSGLFHLLMTCGKKEFLKYSVLQGNTWKVLGCLSKFRICGSTYFVEEFLIIIGDSKLNNVNSCGLSTSRKIELLNHPGGTNSDIFGKTDDVLDDKSESLTVHVGTNDLTNYMNLLNNIRKIATKAKKKSTNTC